MTILLINRSQCKMRQEKPLPKSPDDFDSPTDPGSISELDGNPTGIVIISKINVEEVTAIMGALQLSGLFLRWHASPDSSAATAPRNQSFPRQSKPGIGDHTVYPACLELESCLVCTLYLFFSVLDLTLRSSWLQDKTR